MGLDSTLYREKYVTPSERGDVYIGGKQIKDVMSIRTEVMYWRKAWHIHRFFQNRSNEGGSSDFYVNPTTLLELRDICRKMCSYIELEERSGRNAQGYTSSYLVARPIIKHSDKLMVKEEMKKLDEKEDWASDIDNLNDENSYFLVQIRQTMDMLDKLTEDEEWSHDDYFYSSSW